MAHLWSKVIATSRVRIAALLVALVLGFGLYASTFVASYRSFFQAHDPLLASDVARLTPTRVARVAEVHQLADLRSALADAQRRGLKVSIAGSRHSQGGHTYTANGVVLNMRQFNAVLGVDTVAMTVAVQSGATWDEVQRVIAPAGLALKVMQSSNVFTVGGSVSANAHGRDVDITQMVEVVQSLRLLLADGSVVEVSRTDHPELFSLVVGGYGLYGVILDVTLQVTRDEWYQPGSVVLDYTELPEYLEQEVKSDSSVALMIARPSIDPDADLFLRELVVATWRRLPGLAPARAQLTDERHVLRDRFFFGLSRQFDWAKAFRWNLQKRLEPTLSNAQPISRNNAMRPPIVPVEFLEYHSDQDTDILQEYFVPIGSFVSFMDSLRAIMLAHRVNLLSATVRYVTPDSTVALAYAPRTEALAVVLLMNVDLTTEGQVEASDVTRQIVDAAIGTGGTYYLTYQLYPTPQQLHRAYPNALWAFERKRFYDPSELFSSRFYERYGHARLR